MKTFLRSLLALAAVSIAAALPGAADDPFAGFVPRALGPSS